MSRPTKTITRHNGWTPERERMFFATLAAGNSVTRACVRVGLSREAAYKARRRDADFARQWENAQVSARREAKQAFMDGLPERLRDALVDRAQV